MTHIDEHTQQLKEAFAKFDTNNEGTITAAKLSAVMRSVGMNASDAEVQEMVTRVSPTGSVSLDQYLQLMHSMEDVDCEAGIKELYHTLDPEHKGSITPSEFRYALDSVGLKFTQDEVDEMLVAADVDGDGLINYEEFVKVLVTLGRP
ncbi:hypothetical protein GGF31_008099 [Allomyces arbusculus]|nr:hypothetical protein GGF31_008099 [Allomyces arbusculus]